MESEELDSDHPPPITSKKPNKVGQARIQSCLNPWGKQIWIKSQGDS